MKAPGHPGEPRGLCPADLALYEDDEDISELEHEACRIAAQQHHDQFWAWAWDPHRRRINP